MNLHDIQNRLAEISVDVEALIEVAGDSPSAEHQEQILALNKEAQELEAKHDEAKKFEKAKAEIVARRKLAAEAADAPAAGVSRVFLKTSPRKTKWQSQPKLDTQNHATSLTTKMHTNPACFSLQSAGARRLRSSWRLSR